MSAPAAAAAHDALDVGDRVGACDWTSIAGHLDAFGWAPFPGLLTAAETAAVAQLYEDDRRFRSHVIMARHGFGRGEYKYFAHPLPEIVTALRTALYAPLAPIANRWNEQMGIGVRFPAAHDAFLARCREAGQTRPTPLFMKY
jgi:hypothetical protein